jgi:Na+/phosphate symporter
MLFLFSVNYFKKVVKSMKVSSIFFAVFAAITTAVFIFALHHLPSGVGITSVSIEAYARPSIFG